MVRYIRRNSIFANKQVQEQAIMKEVWEYLSNEQPNAVQTYDNGASGYIDINDLKPKYAYYMADMLAKETANKDNYFENSIGFWTKVNRRPRGDSNHKSVYWYTDKKGSEYWYTNDGVYRNSDHWGRRIASCSWWIDEENPKRTTGFIRWEDLKPKGTLYMNTKEKAASNPDCSYLNLEQITDDLVFWVDGFMFEKPRYY